MPAPRQRRSFQTLETRTLMAADLSASVAAAPEPEWFIADSFSFGVEREMKESGEKGGTADPHLTGGDAGGADRPAYLKYKLDRCFVKSWSTSGDADDRPTEESEETKPMAWDNTAQKPWGDAGLAFGVDAIDEALADDRPTEEVAFYYNKIAFGYAKTTVGDGIDAVVR